jgi:surface antigen
MRERRNLVNGRLKMDVAREVMREVIRAIPTGTDVALRTYGRTIAEGRPRDCQDTELLQPLGKIDHPTLLRQIDQIHALGTTPIAYSLEQAAHDFSDEPGQKIIILITDGKEECGGKVQETAASFRARGLDVMINVVGFALADRTTKEIMEQVAAVTGGRFYDATNQTELVDAIHKAIAAPFELRDAAGERMAVGTTGADPVEPPEGLFELLVRTVGESLMVPEVPIEHGHWTRVELKKAGEEVDARILGPLPIEEAPWDAAPADEPDSEAITVARIEPGAPPPGPEPATGLPGATAALPPVAPAGPDPELVGTVQRKLAQLGFAPGPADGVFGRRTAEAIQAFEMAARLPASGAVSDVLDRRLDAALADDLHLRYRADATLLGGDLDNVLRGALTDADLRKVQVTYSFALGNLPAGETARWRSDDDPGRGGTITVGSPLEGGRCRSYTQRITAAGRTSESAAALVACMDANNAWGLAGR